jgi:hypothetical protein
MARRIGVRAAGRLVFLVAAYLLAAPHSAIAAEQHQGARPRLTDLTLDQLGDVEVTSVSKRPEEIFSPHHVEFGRTPGPAVGISRSIYLERRWRRPDARP